MLCLVRYLFVISTSVIYCLGRFVPEMTYYVSSGTLNLAQLNSTQLYGCVCSSVSLLIWYDGSQSLDCQLFCDIGHVLNTRAAVTKQCNWYQPKGSTSAWQL